MNEIFQQQKLKTIKSVDKNSHTQYFCIVNNLIKENELFDFI